MKTLTGVALIALAMSTACGGGSKSGGKNSETTDGAGGSSTTNGGAGGTTANSGGSGGAGATTRGSGGQSAGGSGTGGGAGAEGSATNGGGAAPSSDAAHDFCNDVGDALGMGAAIFGDPGTDWYESAAQAPTDIAWTYGYMYASGDPHEDLEGFEWLLNYRLDTAEQAGASIPTVTFYRMLNVGREHGHDGSEAEVVQAMLDDAEAMADYLDDFVVVLDILAARETPTLLHVEPDSWGFMMWAFDGFDGTLGNPDAGAVSVALIDQPALAGETFSNDAEGLGQAMRYLRDQRAPEVRLGWHASNFRVGTKPEVVTAFYANMGAWDVIVSEPPHMNGSGSSPWDTSDEDNANNLNWLSTVSSATGLPIVIWQTYVGDAEAYLGAWPDNQDNLSLLAENGVVGVLWDPNGNGGDCAYSCAEAATLEAALAEYSAAPLEFPSENVCGAAR